MVDMGDATRLIGDLHQKLADLDHKVAAYRQDMAAEFYRYSHQLLKNVPHDLSAEVDRAVAASFDNYPALRPALVSPRDSLDSPPPPPTTHHAGNLAETHSNPGAPRHPPPSPSPKSTPPSVLPHAGTAVLTSPDTAYDRERDRDFHGLFTPSYLPLLDGSHMSPAPANPSPTLSPTPKPATDDDMGRYKSGQPGGLQPAVQLSAAATQTPGRPNHERRATDDTTSSCASEQSDSKVRRSALRRASTGSKPPPSPRRVRFEFEGVEVLPTASPHSSEPSLVLSHTLANSRSPPPPEDDPMSVESILGPDEDSGPPPKKVSSSQALRALSRAPLDSNTVWTVVNPDALERENGSMATSDSETSLQMNDTPQSAPKPQPPQKTTALEHEPTPETSSRPSLAAVDRQRDYNTDEDGDSSSDDEFLAMAKPKSFANKKAILSPLSRSPTRMAPVLYSPTQDKTGSHNEIKSPIEQRDSDSDDDGEELFHFEGLSAPPKPRSRPPPIQEEDEDEDEGDEKNDTNEPVAPKLYSTSPAVSIPRAPEPAIPAHLISGSVGSFKGRPVTMPIVKNPDVYQQAASLGDVNTFIGGLDGSSGVDDGDLNSYRASIGQVLFSGTPRSLTERMMMEEAHSQIRAAARRPH
ncbi:hypothetical protein CGRA01v4_06932 [Colletotrichum graminicola]|uniref:Uncharacterized protein n=1 Tax=Colletotrichum graminicola (strain M1.001 / M2 / FGSC 10212) TaxID=645133 RepID=E3QR60_COLGM|nr:uncharacterized protein GLRG_08492 [Colletotrichum graminicola M1.001]EFQ33348.1 hypothetical protein GLRG_08492 [Colletotrichum graminicola M1.001]WDK15651.1 hypothetical protein CGRA01v4_06932 [Colletotrichum graminicola]